MYETQRKEITMMPSSNPPASKVKCSVCGAIIYQGVLCATHHSSPAQPPCDDAHVAPGCSLFSDPSKTKPFPASKVKRIAPDSIVPFPGWLWHYSQLAWAKYSDRFSAPVMNLLAYGYTYYHPDQPEAPKEGPTERVSSVPGVQAAYEELVREHADLPAPASEESEDLGGEHETAKKVCAVLRGIVTIDEDQRWDLLVGGVAQLRAVLFSPQNPTTDEAIAREAAKEINAIKPRTMSRFASIGDLHEDYQKEVAAIILRAIQRARPPTKEPAYRTQFRQALKDANAITVAEHAKVQKAPPTSSEHERE